MPLFTSDIEIADEYPTIEPSLRLDFANSRALDSSMKFLRASSATYVGEDGRIRTVVENEPRFDHDPTTGESLGLLIEEERTNFFENSETVGGTATGDFFRGKEIHNKTVNINQLYFASDFENYNIQAGDVYTLTGFIRAGSQTGNILIRWIDALNAPVSGVNNFSYTPTTDGEFVSFEFTFSQTFSGSCNCALTGSSGDDADFAIMQLEKGSFPTSYIPTNGSTAIRYADLVYSDTSKFLSPGEGTIITKFTWLNIGTPGAYGKVLFSLNKIGGFGDGIYVSNEPSQTSTSIRILNNSNAEFSEDLFTINPNPTELTIAIAYEKDNVGITKNGGSVLVDSSATIPTMERLVVGDNAWGLDAGSGYSNQLNPGNCHIKSFIYYPKRLVNNQLRSLTQ